jgi:GMP synthase (glutamine-hydrolysing)
VHEKATQIINRNREVNRVVATAGSAAPVEQLSIRPAAITAERLDRLRAADAIVREMSQGSGFEDSVWQFPVILVPVGTAGRPDSVVLRPIHSVDGMTARSVPMPEPLLRDLTQRLLALDGVAAVFYDLTHKPPGTIEWE